MSEQSPSEHTTANRSKFFYGWVIVAVCTLMVAISYGLMYSFSVFFKPLADYFDWDRSTVSLIYSASLIIRGFMAIVVGWLADRYGSIKITVFCGIMIGLGLILSSQTHALWQFFIAYGVIEAIGLSGAFGIGTGITSRWFVKNRGLALGFVASGSGLGTFIIVPGNERLIAAFGWSQAFIICGIIAGLVMASTAFLLRPPSVKSALLTNKKTGSLAVDSEHTAAPHVEITFGQAIKDSRMILFLASALLFFFSIQMIIVHLVNYATDMGIPQLVAASFISAIGAISIAGRISMGIGTDKIGIYNTLILTRILLMVSLIFLIFTRSLWAFYIFALLFGLSYGGEIPQIPLFIGKYWGTKALATLVGFSMFVISLGGALGPWIAGKIYDSTQSYEVAFIIGIVASLASLVLVLVLKSRKRATD